MRHLNYFLSSIHQPKVLYRVIINIFVILIVVFVAGNFDNKNAIDVNMCVCMQCSNVYYMYVMTFDE